ncbi:hypothetical protein ACQR1H_31175 [Bradyrhizobium sp. HKCCYLRH2015]|uniref:hypothetical protein n=1 Tax=Bradyrhizobium TaxID=374 RepID=UPI003EB7EB27
MRLIASVIGRCLKLFSWEEIRPVHGISPAILASAIADRFQFQIKPPLPLPPDSVAKFGDGSVVIGDILIAIQRLETYSDGFSVDCSNTDDAKLVSDEIVNWAQADLGFKPFIRPPKHVFLSQVTVEFAPEFENIFRGWKRLQALLGERAKSRYEFTQDVNLLRLQWRGDPFTLANNTLLSDFWIERKAAEPFSANRWHCSGALPTSEWVELLEAMERIAVHDDISELIQNSNGGNF